MNIQHVSCLKSTVFFALAVWDRRTDKRINRLQAIGCSYSLGGPYCQYYWDYFDGRYRSQLQTMQNTGSTVRVRAAICVILRSLNGIDSIISHASFLERRATDWPQDSDLIFGVQIHTPNILGLRQLHGTTVSAPIINCLQAYYVLPAKLLTYRMTAWRCLCTVLDILFMAFPCKKMLRYTLEKQQQSLEKWGKSERTWWWWWRCATTGSA